VREWAVTKIRISPAPPFGPGGPHIRVGFVGGGPGGPGLIGLFLALVLIVAVVVLAVALFRRERQFRQGGPTGSGNTPASEALNILNERFARGDIDPEDFKVRRDLLQGPA
jgi:putative membrane protein